MAPYPYPCSFAMVGVLSFAWASVQAFSPPTILARRTHPTLAPTSASYTASTRLDMVFDLPVLDVEEQEPESKKSTQFLIDRILDECLRYSARRPIMRQFDPASRSIWKHWRGTVVAATWKSALKHAFWAAAVYLVFKKYPKSSMAFEGFSRVWSELLAVTTFTLTFFVNEAYSCWRSCLSICYNLQGRLNDFSMTLAGFAKRVEPPMNSDPSQMESNSKFTPEARKVLMIISRYLRLFNILSYASFTRSHRPLLTPQGMRGMVRRGLLTEKEHEILINSRVAATARHNEVLMWMFRTALDARRAGHFNAVDSGFEPNLLLRVQEIRSQGNYMECVLRGRMPFGYANIVQVLVDVVTKVYPFAAFSSGLSLRIGVVGIMALCMTYQGLFDLSKRFLDPFHNESFWEGHDPIQVDTLIAETNAGSRRYLFALHDMPIPFQVIQDGGSGLDTFLLPDEGFTEEEMAQKEAEKKLLLEAEKLAMSQAASVQEVDTFEEDQQAAQEQFEETQAILSAPPGADFVPGIDDQEESMPIVSNSTEALPKSSVGIENDADPDDDYEPPSKKLYDQFVETAAEEYEEAKRREELKD